MPVLARQVVQEGRVSGAVPVADLRAVACVAAQTEAETPAYQKFDPDPKVLAAVARMVGARRPPVAQHLVSYLNSVRAVYSGQIGVVSVGLCA